MKTTQSGFEGFIVDEYTTLKPTKDRVMSTKIFCEYHFNHIEDFDKIDFSKIYDAVQQVCILLSSFSLFILTTFFDDNDVLIFQCTLEHFSGDPVTGVYSPSVQKTIYDTSKEVLKVCVGSLEFSNFFQRYPFLEKITFKLPNIHYYAVNFDDFKTDLKNNGEVFLTFDGAHGQIEATIQRPTKAKL